MELHKLLYVTVNGTIKDPYSRRAIAAGLYPYHTHGSRPTIMVPVI